MFVSGQTHTAGGIHPTFTEVLRAAKAFLTGGEGAPLDAAGQERSWGTAADGDGEGPVQRCWAGEEVALGRHCH